MGRFDPPSLLRSYGAARHAGASAKAAGRERENGVEPSPPGSMCTKRPMRDKFTCDPGRRRAVSGRRGVTGSRPLFQALVFSAASARKIASCFRSRRLSSSSMGFFPYETATCSIISPVVASSGSTTVSESPSRRGSCLVRIAGRSEIDCQRTFSKFVSPKLAEEVQLLTKFSSRAPSHRREARRNQT